jgi:hypothetical protein
VCVLTSVEAVRMMSRPSVCAALMEALSFRFDLSVFRSLTTSHVILVIGIQQQQLLGCQALQHSLSCQHVLRKPRQHVIFRHMW